MKNKSVMADSKIVVFQDKQIRRVWVDDDWYFSIVDIVGVLTGSPEPRKYWNKVKTREFTDLQLSPIWRQLELPAADGKQYKTDCATTQAMFRIIQSIPSPKAEPFKQLFRYRNKSFYPDRKIIPISIAV